MRITTRKKYSLLQQSMCQTYGVNSVSSAFAVTEPLETRLIGKIQDSSAFLQMINMLPVTDKKGQALNIWVTNPLAKRTDVSNKDRQPVFMSPPDGLEYECMLTETDIAFSYELLDIWARYENFMEMYLNQVYRRIALDKILIGWYGKKAAKETDIESNPNLEDVNKGWLTLLKDEKPEHYLTESSNDTGQITIGKAGDYKNLDAITYDIFSIIEVAQRSGNEVAVVGRQLVADDMGKALSSFAQQPTEKSQVMILEKTYGGLPSLIVPNFPDKGLVVTDPKNLSIYFQSGRMRRKMEDKPERNCVVDFMSSNDAYMIENLDSIAGIEANNVVFLDEEPPQPEKPGKRNRDKEENPEDNTEAGSAV